MWLVPFDQVVISEESHDFPGLGIDAGDVRPLVAIAREAAQAKIAGSCRPFVTFRDDVIDLEGKPIAFLRNPAVFAAMAGPLPDQFLQKAFHRA